MRIAPGIIQCEECGEIYPHDQSYQHFMDNHDIKGPTTTLREIYAQAKNQATAPPAA